MRIFFAGWMRWCCWCNFRGGLVSDSGANLIRIRQNGDGLITVATSESTVLSFGFGQSKKSFGRPGLCRVSVVRGRPGSASGVLALPELQIARAYHFGLRREFQNSPCRSPVARGGDFSWSTSGTDQGINPAWKSEK